MRGGLSPDFPRRTLRQAQGDNAQGRLKYIIPRNYGGDIGRVDLQYNNYIAVISKQKFFEKEQWMLSGYKVKSDAERESYNPKSYAPYSFVSRSKVVADFKAKIQQKINAVLSESKGTTINLKSQAPSKKL